MRYEIIDHKVLDGTGSLYIGIAWYLVVYSVQGFHACKLQIFCMKSHCMQQIQIRKAKGVHNIFFYALEPLRKSDLHSTYFSAIFTSASFEKDDIRDSFDGCDKLKTSPYLPQFGKIPQVSFFPVHFPNRNIHQGFSWVLKFPEFWHFTKFDFTNRTHVDNIILHLQSSLYLIFYDQS